MTRHLRIYSCDRFSSRLVNEEKGQVARTAQYTRTFPSGISGRVYKHLGVRGVTQSTAPRSLPRT